MITVAVIQILVCAATMFISKFLQPANLTVHGLFWSTRHNKLLLFQFETYKHA